MSCVPRLTDELAGPFGDRLTSRHLERTKRPMTITTDEVSQSKWHEDPDLLRLAMAYYDKLDEAKTTEEVFGVERRFTEKASIIQAEETTRLAFLRHLSAQAAGRIEVLTGC
jgi:hypothetical protein